MQNSSSVNKFKKKVFIDTIEFSFGLIHRNTDQIIHTDNQVKEYLEHRGEAIFIMFVGAVNHWVAFIAAKENYEGMDGNSRRSIQCGEKKLTKFYLLDSSNINHLD